MSRSNLLAALIVAAVSSGCIADPVVPPDPDITQVTFAASLGIDLTKMTKSSTGLYTRDLTVGTGAAATTGKQVSLHYFGWLSNGTQFDANQAPTTPLKFTIGANQVIPGFEEGVRGMLIGGRRQIIVPPSLGYGSTANGPIPANSVLVFQIDLVAVQ